MMTIEKMKLKSDRPAGSFLTRVLNTLGLLLPLLVFTGCPADTDLVPAYVMMEGFELQTPGQGTPTSDIPEVWVFADAEFIGVFGLPARIPVPRAGSSQIRLEPGVRQNGSSATPEPYDFYTPVNLTLELTPGETINIGTQPITYKPEVRFSIFETFEPGDVRAFSEVINGMGTLAPTQEIVRTGDYSGKIHLTADSPVFEVASEQSFPDLTATRRYVWLEMDFLSAADGRIGVSGSNGLNSSSLFDPSFRPQEQWTKIYFDITNIIVDLNLDPIQINLAAILPQDLEEGDVYLDNIKLIHF
ncbi:hypothetical protein FUA23_13125 [Neolewinella aurantiaca]|uniref:Uncharacterized protein n=1 Tax=Neolewinella aurantiaca TaxID=2602767 RepID=A0A5C7FEV4_9BACT|nr:hypothetical protein [Neolewinella aurantiaca]TXF88788.1 hypothetical protein FUA23_13125 [Neolewinella aurantiaca]